MRYGSLIDQEQINVHLYERLNQKDIENRETNTLKYPTYQ
jgi:hypothetical protein